MKPLTLTNKAVTRGSLAGDGRKDRRGLDRSSNSGAIADPCRLEINCCGKAFQPFETFGCISWMSQPGKNR